MSKALSSGRGGGTFGFPSRGPPSSAPQLSQSQCRATEGILSGEIPVEIIAFDPATWMQCSNASPRKLVLSKATVQPIRVNPSQIAT
jgi:hypothetical protein